MTSLRATLYTAAALACLGTQASAADLPVFGDRLPPASFGPPPQPGLATNPFRGPFVVEPRRFDAYGYPVYGPIAVSPNPLFAATGCPQVLQPVYDGAGNFVGYGPMPGCR